MRQSLLKLEPFYQTPLGRAAQKMACRRLTALWPHLEGAEVLGCGYTLPYLEPYQKHTKRLVYAYLDGQGFAPVHSRRGNISTEILDAQMPFPPAIFDHVLLAHALEETPNIAGFLAELWRVMKPEARIVVIAANRGGLWARSEQTPFGAGRPFTQRQLSKILRDAGFVTLKRSGALYCPPMPRLCSTRIAGVMETFGETVWPGFSGLVLVEAVKRLYAGNGSRERAKVRRPKFTGSGVVGMPGKVTHPRKVGKLENGHE